MIPPCRGYHGLRLTLNPNPYLRISDTTQRGRDSGLVVVGVDVGVCPAVARGD